MKSQGESALDGDVLNKEIAVNFTFALEQLVTCWLAEIVVMRLNYFGTASIVFNFECRY